MDEEDYWTISESRAFSFDEDELVKKQKPKVLPSLHSGVLYPNRSQNENRREASTR